MITRSMFVLSVPNLERSGAFYRDVLGFDVEELGDPCWRLFVRDECRIMACEAPDAIPARQLGDHSYFIYLVVDDVEAYFARVNASRVEIVKQIASERWGMREFGLCTVDGHRIMIAQALRLA